jgi:hypothetical protein
MITIDNFLFKLLNSNLPLLTKFTSNDYSSFKIALNNEFLFFSRNKDIININYDYENSQSIVNAVVSVKNFSLRKSFDKLIEISENNTLFFAKIQNETKTLDCIKDIKTKILQNNSLDSILLNNKYIKKLSIIDSTTVELFDTKLKIQLMINDRTIDTFIYLNSLNTKLLNFKNINNFNESTTEDFNIFF